MVQLFRAETFCYVSFESALRQYGAIYKAIPVLTVTTTGKFGLCEISVGDFLFTHLAIDYSASFSANLFWDSRRLMRIASPKLAYEDLREIDRNLNLVDRVDLEWAMEEYPAKSLPPDDFRKTTDLEYA